MTAADRGPRAGQSPRPLSDEARDVLDALLAHDFLGAAELRAQVGRATATAGCRCGCGTLDLQVPDDVPAAPASGPAPVEGTIVGADGASVGGLLLFVEDGRLSRLDVTSHGDPLPLPSPDQVTWGPTRWAGADTVRRPARFRRGRPS